MQSESLRSMRLLQQKEQTQSRRSRSSIKDGSLHVFDTSTFTVNGSSLEDLIAEGGDYAKYADYVSDGYYHESELASAPSFDIIIDGITSQAN